MSIRKSGKILALVGFVISFSCIGILYSNLTTVTEERSHILTEKNSEIESLKHSLSEREIEIQNQKVLNNDLKAKLQEFEDDKVRQLQKVEEANNLLVFKENDVNGLNNKISLLEVEKQSLDEELSSCRSSSDSLQMSLKTKHEEVDAANSKLQLCESKLSVKEEDKKADNDDVDAEQAQAPPIKDEVKKIKPDDVNLAPPNQEVNEMKQPDENKNIPQAQNPAPADIPNNVVVDNNNPANVLAEPPPAANPIDLDAIKERNEEVQNIQPLQPAAQLQPQEDDIKQANERNEQLNIQINPVNDNL